MIKYTQIIVLVQLSLFETQNLMDKFINNVKELRMSNESFLGNSQVPNIGMVKAVSASKFFTAVLNQNNMITYWWNTQKFNYQPNVIENVYNVSHISAGKFIICSIIHVEQQEKTEDTVTPGNLKCLTNLNEYNGLFNTRININKDLRAFVIDVSVGTDQLCVVKLDNFLRCLHQDQKKKKVNMHVYIPPTLKGNAKSIHVSEDQACAITTASNLLCWKLFVEIEAEGDINSAKEGKSIFFSSYLQFKSAQVGSEYFCAIDLEDKLNCFTTRDGKKVTVHPDIINNVKSVNIRFRHMCVVKNDFSTVCWDFAKEVDHHLNGSSLEISLGYNHTCQIRTDYTLKCFDEILGAIRPDLIPISLQENVNDIQAGKFQNIVLNRENKLTFQQIHPQFLGTLKLESTKTQKMVSAGFNDFCAIDSLNVLYCYNLIDKVTPTGQKLLTDATQVSVGTNMICALDKKHLMLCWVFIQKINLSHYNLIPRVKQPKNLIMTPQNGISGDSLYTCTYDDTKIVCWSEHGKMEGFQHIMFAQVEQLKVNPNQFCFTDKKYLFKCQRVDHETKEVGEMPISDSLLARSFSMNRNIICVINISNELNCCFENGRQAFVPESIRVDVTSVSVGHTHICAVKLFKTQCWLADQEQYLQEYE